MGMLQKGIKISFLLQDYLAGISLETEDRGRPLNELNVRFNIHVTVSIILSNFWYLTARRYHKEF